MTSLYCHGACHCAGDATLSGSSNPTGPRPTCQPRRHRWLSRRLYAASTASVCATPAKYCASITLNVSKREASLFSHSPGQIAPAASNCFNFWLLLFSLIPLPPSEVTINVSGHWCAGATFSASETFATNCAHFFMWRDAGSLGTYTLAFEPASARRTLHFSAIK